MNIERKIQKLLRQGYTPSEKVQVALHHHIRALEQKLKEKEDLISDYKLAELHPEDARYLAAKLIEEKLASTHIGGGMGFGIIFTRDTALGILAALKARSSNGWKEPSVEGIDLKGAVTDDE